MDYEKYIEQCLDPKKRPLDRNRGIQLNDFVEKIAASKYCGIEEIPGTDIRDPYGSLVKPKNVPAWDHPPVTPQEEALYYGVHIHSESNPLGLHTHVKGGKPAGGHSHGPQNRLGSHSHKSDGYGTLDGDHIHDPTENKPCGEHGHMPENFA